jgi:hypothetical protein
VVSREKLGKNLKLSNFYGNDLWRSSFAEIRSSVIYSCFAEQIFFHLRISLGRNAEAQLRSYKTSLNVLESNNVLLQPF